MTLSVAPSESQEIKASIGSGSGSVEVSLEASLEGSVEASLEGSSLLDFLLKANFLSRSPDSHHHYHDVNFPLSQNINDYFTPMSLKTGLQVFLSR